MSRSPIHALRYHADCRANTHEDDQKWTFCRSINNSRIWFNIAHHLLPSNKAGSGGSGIQNKSNKPKSKCAAPKYGEPIIKKIEGKSFKCNLTTKCSNTQLKYMLIFKTHETDKRTTVYIQPSWCVA